MYDLHYVIVSPHDAKISVTDDAICITWGVGSNKQTYTYSRNDFKIEDIEINYYARNIRDNWLEIGNQILKDIIKPREMVTCTEYEISDSAEKNLRERHEKIKHKRDQATLSKIKKREETRQAEIVKEEKRQKERLEERRRGLGVKGSRFKKSENPYLVYI